jgi:hypothetical protein
LTHGFESEEFARRQHKTMINFSASHASRRAHAATLLLLPALLFSGCQPRRSANTAAAQRPAATQKAQPKTQSDPGANIYVDEAMLSKPYAVIGGTVENVGGERLENLSVEIELRRRDGGSTERRTVEVRPGSLEPGARGKYALKVLSDEWGGSRVVGLRAGTDAREVAYKSLPGAKRPPERPGGNVVIVNTPQRKKSSGDDFINTPDTPIRVP